MKAKTMRAGVTRATVAGRLRVMEARKLPHEVQFRTNVAMHSDGGHMIAGFVCGAGFTLEVAQEIARRTNAHEAMRDLLERVAKLDSPHTIVDQQKWDVRDCARDARAILAKARGQ